MPFYQLFIFLHKINVIEYTFYLYILFLFVSQIHVLFFFFFSNRDINSLMDKGGYISEAKSWSDSIQGAMDDGQDMVEGFAITGEIASYRGNWLHVGSLVTRETSKGPYTAPLIKNNHKFGPGEST